MSAQMLSFTRTIDELQLQRAMGSVLLALATDTDQAELDAEARQAMCRQVVTIKAGFADLCAQLGMAPPAFVREAVS